MKQIILTSVLSFSLATVAVAQEKLWTMDECMHYAVENSPKVKKQAYTSDSYKAELNSAVASFFPSMSASVGAQYNFGRSVDPGTNIYSNTSTFNNAYGLNVSIPIFNGGQLINQWRMAKANRQMGMNDVQKEKDDLAINTMQAFMDVVYYQGTVKLAAEQLEENSRILYRTRRQEELGLKGKADVAQIEAQVAANDYNLTHQQNLFNTALLTLKQNMNYPSDVELDVDTLLLDKSYATMMESVDEIYDYASDNNPVALQAKLQLKSYKMQYLMAKGRLLPTISFSAGISTNYFENLKVDKTADDYTPTMAFGDQFSNNRGEYISFNLSFPLFDGLSRLTNVRKARNSVRIAQEQQTEVLRQLQTAIEQAILDREGYAKETIQMEKKAKADEIAYQVTLRKFEEGLMSPIDLQTSANTLLLSKADLLQRKLMYLMKCKLVDYYKGKPLIEGIN
ncbi:TolC family protein [uncultured Parabacteroides sp.]|jgi:outer membrane protein|uniref:TolC family protein n=1 Tax=uncultured Parabacteroides sp. TaxID=512312 RepID=UPI0025DC5DCC|nr:TolC family protein [uncultured Parabacteroides sp.]